MKMPERVSWDIIKSILPVTDNVAIKRLRASNGKADIIPVQLHRNGEQVLSAEAHILTSHDYLFILALELVWNRICAQGIELEWDHASFENKDQLFYHEDILDVDPIAIAAKEFSRHELVDTFKAIRHQHFSMPDMPLDEKSLYDHFAAAVLANTSVVVSQDLERLIHEKEHPGKPFQHVEGRDQFPFAI